MKTTFKKSVMALALAAVLPGAAWADEREDLETLRQTTLNLVQALVQTGVLTQEKADELIRSAQRTAASKVAAEQKREQEGAPKVVRVPYVPQHVRNEIKDELRQEVMAQAKGERWAAPGAMPEWISRIKLSGDLRLRQQWVQQDPDNGSYASVVDTNNLGTSAESYKQINTTDDYQMSRLRLRLGLDAKLSDAVNVGLRLSTGSSGNPVSTNQTLGTGANRYSINVDNAWLKYQPLPWLTASGGRMPNPWFSTDLVWDEDLAFEGLAASFRPAFGESTTGFLTLGVFPLETPDCSLATDTDTCSRKKRIDGVQLGVEHAWSGGNRMKFGVAYYDFKNIAAERNPASDPTNKANVPKWAQKGNTIYNIRPDVGTPWVLGLAADFRELNVTGTLDVAAFDTARIVVTGDYVKNIGYDEKRMLERTGLSREPRTVGHYFGVLVGQPQIKRRGEWQASLGHKYLERDAVVDGYTDSDFHLGGTDAKGWIVGGSYGIDANTWLRLRWLTADAIDGQPAAIDVLQLDLNARF